MQQQTRDYSVVPSVLWIVCCVFFAMAASPVFGDESPFDSPLSSFGLTDEKFENEVKEYLGIPYRKGGNSRKGMDCSGFARKVYSSLFGIELPHNSIQQYKFSALRKIDDEELQPGDLIFFANKKRKRVNHVGVYLSDGQFIHASSSQGVTVSNLDDRYWKTRFVGSKRHMALNPEPGFDEIRLEGSLEIPIRDRGTITGYARDEFRSAFPTFSKTDSALLDDNSCNVRESDSHRLHFYEIGYGQTLSTGFQVNLSTIHETFDVSTAWRPGLDPFSTYMSYRYGGFSGPKADRQGIRLAGDIRPSSWISITPSITYFDYTSENMPVLDVPKRTFGLNTLLSPLHNRWSLAMSLHYSDQEELASLSTPDDMLSSLDMAVKLGIHLTHNLQFSIMGKHDVRSEGFSDTTPSFLQPSSSDLFLTLDWNY